MLNNKKSTVIFLDFKIPREENNISLGTAGIGQGFYASETQLSFAEEVKNTAKKEAE